MSKKPETLSENYLRLLQSNLFYLEDMHNFNNPLDEVLPDGFEINTEDAETQTNVRVLTTSYLPLIVYISPNANDSKYRDRFSDELSEIPSSFTPTTGSPVMIQPPRPPSPPLLPPIPLSTVTRILPSVNPFLEPPRALLSAVVTPPSQKAETNTEDSTESTTPQQVKRRRPNVTGNDIYRGGELVPDTMYAANARVIEEFNKLMRKRVVCCMDHKSIQKILCFRYQNQENQYICYSCAVNVNRDDISDWSIGIDFTGERMYQCSRLSHARPIWFYIKQVNENNMCSLCKMCQYCKTFTQKYSPLVNNR